MTKIGEMHCIEEEATRKLRENINNFGVRTALELTKIPADIAAREVRRLLKKDNFENYPYHTFLDEYSKKISVSEDINHISNTINNLSDINYSNDNLLSAWSGKLTKNSILLTNVDQILKISAQHKIDFPDRRILKQCLNVLDVAPRRSMQPNQLIDSAYFLTMYKLFIIPINEEISNRIDLSISNLLYTRISFVESLSLSSKHKLVRIFNELGTNFKKTAPKFLPIAIENFNNEILANITISISNSQQRIFNKIKEKYPKARMEEYISEISAPVDIYIPEAKLIIQVDGNNAHNYRGNGKINAATAFNTASIEKAGYSLIRIDSAVNVTDSIFMDNIRKSVKSAKLKLENYLSIKTLSESCLTDFEANSSINSNILSNIEYTEDFEDSLCGKLSSKSIDSIKSSENSESCLTNSEINSTKMFSSLSYDNVLSNKGKTEDSFSNTIPPNNIYSTTLSGTPESCLTNSDNFSLNIDYTADSFSNTISPNNIDSTIFSGTPKNCLSNSDNFSNKDTSSLFDNFSSNRNNNVDYSSSSELSDFLGPNIIKSLKNVFVENEERKSVKKFVSNKKGRSDYIYK